MPPPEALAREQIDRLLAAAGWSVQDAGAANLFASRGVAVREVGLRPGHGTVDYLLYVDRKSAGVVEAKPEGTTLTGVEVQAAKYSEGLPELIPAHIRPLPFLYQSTGVETRFTNRLDPEPRSRELFHFHRPETLATWLAEAAAARRVAEGARPGTAKMGATFRARLRLMPPLNDKGRWPAQRTAVRNLECSLGDDRPRALIQMATGSGKTFTAITSIYRLVKFAGARRVLFLVDRANLGRQALKEFQSYRTPDDGRLFTELYNVQHLTSNTLDSVANVCIATIQRLYSMLRGDEELQEEMDETSLAGLESVIKEPVPVAYNPRIPIETFDVTFVDECHRSIYTIWKQVLDYFDAHLVGLTATPSKQTFGFFNQNLVMEYGHEQAVADRVNVDFDVYRIRTRISEAGSHVEAGLYVDQRDRETRRKRWTKLDEDLVYGANALDRDVVAPDQIRTVVKAFKERLFTEVFPGRTEVPKTLIFAKDDSHADDIVQIVREEFGRGNDFAQKITYRTTGATPESLITAFRNSYYPRVAVTVDMIATGTDIKPLEVVMFMRQVRSRNLFEQMKGRGVRVIEPNDFRSVTPDAEAKTRFVIVDCVGVCEQPLSDTRSLDRQPTVSLEKLLHAVAMGNTDPAVVETLAGRLARLDLRLAPPERASIAELAGGTTLQSITAGIIAALDPDRQLAAARSAAGLAPDAEPSEAQRREAVEALVVAPDTPSASANSGTSESTALALPRGWAWATVGELAECVEYGSSAKTSEDVSGIPVFRMGNIVDGRLRSDDMKYLPPDHDEFPRLLLRPGDVLFNRTNSPELVGKTAVYKGQPAIASFASYLIRVRTKPEVVPDYLAAYINSSFGRGWVASVVSQQVGQANVNGSKLRALRIPLPPVEEQQRIVAEVERRLSVLERTEAEIGAQLKRAARLRQAILKRAFEGKLVPQNPSDEPASVLLERIRAERALHAVPPRKRASTRTSRRP